MLHARRSVRLFGAAALWMAVGVGLSAVGAWWLARGGAVPGFWGVPVAVALGIVKGRYVLRPMAARNGARIVRGPARSPLWTLFPVTTWTLMAGFMTLGAVLRRTAVPRGWLGALYLAVGSALMLGAARGWGEWSRFRAPTDENGIPPAP